MSSTPTAARLSLGQTQALQALLSQRQRLLVLTHNNPDPDSLGSAIGLQQFARLAGCKESAFGLSGKILRAENQEMVRQLGIEMVPLADLDFGQFDCVALVDTQPGFGHTIVPDGCKLEVVIDHHFDCDQDHVAGVAFCDVRCDVGATSSLVANYFQNAGFTPSCEVATALTYGIKTDTADLSRNVSDADLAAYDFLFPLVDREKLVAITRPRLPAAYFQTLKEALRRVRIFEHAALCSLGNIHSAEIVAEVADLLLRMEGIQEVFCGGLVDCTYYVSVRTQLGGSAWRFISDAMEGEEGTFGGHGSVAGGSIHLPNSEARTLRRLERRLERNILKSLGLEGASAKSMADKGD